MHQEKTETPQFDWDDSEWMSKITNNPLLCQLSIPGTHDSCAIMYHNGGPGRYYIYVQYYDLAQQLELGSRYIDARCRLTDGVFTMHHGAYYLDINFGDVIRICNDYLKKHPRETILMRVKQEYSTESDQSFINVFNERYKKDNMYMSSEIPHLDEARGKIVIISNVAGLPGIQWNDMIIEDSYDVNVDTKIDKVKSAFNRAHNDNINKNTSMHFTGLNITGSFFGYDPYTASRTINAAIDQYLASLKDSGVNGRELALGIIPIDWYMLNGLLPHRIINLNANL